MEQEISIDFIKELEATHYFVYEDKRYPFNMEFFKYFSQYFQTHKDLYQNTTEISLYDDSKDKISLNESAINDFINFFYGKKITINKENALSIHILAKKFIVPSLIEATSKFISTNQKDLVVELLILNQDNDEFITEEYEEIISKDLPNYINDERLLSLQIPVLYRILKKSYQDDIISENQEQYDQTIDSFLFKCLDHFGRPASVLFSVFQSKCHNFLTNLHEKYSNVFDFHFINSEIVNGFYNKESSILEQTDKLKIELEKMKIENEKTAGEIERLKKQMDEIGSEKEKKIEEQKNEIKKLKDEQEKTAGEIERLKKQMDEIGSEKEKKIEEQKGEIKKLKDEQDKTAGEIERLKKQMDEMKSEKDKEILKLKQDEEEKISLIRTDFSNQLKSMKSKIDELTEKVASLMPKQKEKRITSPSISARFSGSSNRNGLISMLGDGVTLSSTGYPSKDYPITNIKSYNNDYFYNYEGGVPKSGSDSIIKFDFGCSRRVDLYSYFIRSNTCSQTFEHPKSWRIEGSNDDLLWIKLDQRLNDEHLRGEYKEYNFECQENRHLDECRFRFIRYVQEDSWLDKYPYHVHLTYFELYGDIFNN